MGNLITKEIIAEIPDLYETENMLDPICNVKLFTPDSNWTWFILEISKEDLNTCFGYVQGVESELGYFTIKELESVRGPLGLAIERDLMFKPTPLSKIKERREWKKML